MISKTKIFVIVTALAGMTFLANSIFAGALNGRYSLQYRACAHSNGIEQGH